MGNEGMSTSSDKRAMKKALERTRAIQTRAERKDEFASHYDSLKAKYEKIYKSSFNCFSKGKEFKEHWNQQFVLSADKIADIFALFYKERGNDTDEALKKAFELDEKIGRYCNKRRDYLNDTFGELTKKEFFDGEEYYIPFDSAAEKIFGKNPPSKTIWGKSVRGNKELLKHLILLRKLCDIAEHIDIEKLNERNFIKNELFGESQWKKFQEKLDVELNLIRKRGVSPDIFFELLQCYLDRHLFEDYCEGKDSFVDAVIRGTFLF